MTVELRPLVRALTVALGERVAVMAESGAPTNPESASAALAISSARIGSTVGAGHGRAA